MSRSFCCKEPLKKPSKVLGPLKNGKCFGRMRCDFPGQVFSPSCQSLKTPGASAFPSRAPCNWTTSNACTMQMKIETVVSFDVCD